MIFIVMVVLTMCKLKFSRFSQKANETHLESPKSIHCMTKPIRMQSQCPFDFSYESKTKVFVEV